MQPTGGFGQKCNSDGTCDRGLFCRLGTCQPTEVIPGDTRVGGDYAIGGDNAIGGDRNGGDETATVGDTHIGGDTWIPPAFCQDGVTSRPVVRPLAGELIVNELFADAAGDDSGKEWIELFVAADAPVDLNDLVVEQSTTTSSRRAELTSADCLVAAPGDFIVVGASDTDNGNVSVDHVAANLTFLNGECSVTLSVVGSTIDIANLPAAVAAVSANLDPSARSEAGNDDPASFCDARSSGHFDGTGTPGSANDPCGEVCWDGAGYRPIVAPQSGELVITEVYANPEGADDNRDWLELYVAGASSVDLNNLVVENEAGSLRSWTLASNDCVVADPGAYLVIGSSNVATDGVTAQASIDGVLFNAASRLAINHGVLIDEMTYPDPPSGASYSLDAAILDASLNDEPTNWCTATVGQGSFVGLGSPGLVNDPC